MKKLLVAFDVDGTLRCNCTDTCRDPNEEIVQLLRILSRFKNIRVIVWSGGGKEYAEGFVRRYGLEKEVPAHRCFSKLDAPKDVKVAIDDQQDFSMALVNLIVRMK